MKKSSARTLQRAIAGAVICAAITVCAAMLTMKSITKSLAESNLPNAQAAFRTYAEEHPLAERYVSEYLPETQPPAQAAAASSAQFALPELTPTRTTEVTEDDDSELIEINNKIFRGKMLRIKDPSRVFVGVSGELGEGFYGKQIPDIMARYDAWAAINAGGFDDPNGMGTGGTPIGMVMSEGELCYGWAGSTYDVIGFDQDNILHCGQMTGKEALDLGIRDAVCFGPVLIQNGERQTFVTQHTGFNPRSAIGQTADGTVLLLVIEGRQMSSIGASLDDVIDVLLEYGAVTAANLDGGASSMMYKEGELITICSSLNGPRNVPSCWLVRRKGAEN